MIRTERDIPLKLTGLAIFILLIPIALLLYTNIPTDKHLSLLSHVFITLGLTLSILVLGFLTASVCAYFAGLVGSSISPVSGMNLIVLIIMSVIVTALFALFAHATLVGKVGRITLAILATSILAIIGSLGNDNIQDLKAGQLIGATPWKQQFMLMLGVSSAALIIPLVLNLLYNAYGIGGSYPHTGMDPTQMLSAPQATLIASVTRGIIEHHLQWNLIAIGAVLAIILIVLDQLLKQRGLRIHVLAVGLGAYLPFAASMPLFFGGMIAYFVKRRFKRLKHHQNFDKDKAHRSMQTGLLLSCGLVAGSALMGVVLAIPFVLKGSSNALALVSAWFTPVAHGLTLIVTALLIRWIYRTAVGTQGH